MMKKGTVLFIWSLFIWLNFTLFVSSAEENNISVRALLPENQYDKEKTYFDLMMEPGAEQTIRIEIENQKEEEIEVEILVHRAYTSESGIVKYSKTEEKPDSSLKYDLQDIVSVLESVKIRGGEQYFLEADIKMPEEEFEGVIAGGISIQEKREDDNEEKEQQDDRKMEVINEYSYTIGLILRVNEQEVAPKVNLKYISTDDTGTSTNVKARLQNEKPMYMGDIKISTKVSKKGEKDFLYEADVSDYQMAPNSSFDFLIDMNGEKLETGTYTLYLNVNYGDKSWNWKKNFSIKRDSVTEEEIQKGPNKWIYAGIVFFIAAVIAVLVILIKRKTVS